MSPQASAPQERQNGVVAALNTLIAPRQAFESLRIAPTWGWAFLIAIALFIAGSLLTTQANAHAGAAATRKLVESSPFFANMTGAQKQQTIANAEHPPLEQRALGLALTPLGVLLIALLETIVLLIANVLGRGKATFRQLWCAVMNILLIAGIATVVLGAITLLRGPDNFNTMNDVYRAMPSLAMLAPNASNALLAFLSGISIFSAWATVLTGMAMRIIAGTSAILSYTFAILIFFLSALIPASLADALHL